MGWVKSGALVMALLLLLTSCAPSRTIVEPTPAPTAVPYAPSSDAMAVRTLSAVLYYLSADMTRLVPTLRSVQVLSAETVIDALLSELMQDPADESLRAALPSTGLAHILDIEQSQGVVTVNLSGRFAQMEPYRQFAARASITNTLIETGEVRYVNLLVDGQEIPLHRLSDVEGLPTGSMTRFSEDLSMVWSEMEGEHRRIIEAENPAQAQIKRDATLYFASPDGVMLLPETREITAPAGDLITPLIRELARGPSDTSKMNRAIPADAGLLSQPQITRSYDGRTSIELNFSYSLSRFVLEGGGSEQLLYASIVRTLTTFIPQVTEIRVLINGRRITYVGGTWLNDGIVYRSTFPVQVGRAISLYFPRTDGRLRHVTRALTQEAAALPRSWIRELTAGMVSHEAQDEQVMAFPQDFSEQGIRGIALNGDIALINLTKEGADCLRGLSPLEERAVIYSIVNTLTGFAGVTRVQFLVEDRPVDTLAGGISLLEPLLRNPGIIIYTK